MKRILITLATNNGGAGGSATGVGVGIGYGGEGGRVQGVSFGVSIGSSWTDSNCMLLDEALDYALAEVHSMIATCPDAVAYADDIAAYEAKRLELQRFCVRVQRAVDRQIGAAP